MRISIWNSWRLSSVVALMLCAAMGTAWGQQAQPLWDLEVFGFADYAPDYPGSAQNHLHFLPGPWVAYRGETIRTDQIGTFSGRLVHSRRFELDVSAAGSFPVSSSNDTARVGMPNLDWTGEVGPRARLNIFYWQNYATGGVGRLALELPVRTVLSSNFSSRLNYRGIDMAPALVYEANNFLGSGTGFEIALRPEFGTQELMDYFYEVQPRYAIPGRPAYSASAGYLQSELHFRINRPISDSIAIFSTANLDYLGHATNDTSPLFKRDKNYSALLGMSFSFYHSSERAAQ